ncbi:MAG: acyltransferase [Phycisphaeraceae bacterium]|nr:MAG: acyltransferase [Phycisphaeraceae bacterium]
MTTVRAAMTQTVSVYPHMPDDPADLPSLADHLNDIRDANLHHHANLIEAAANAGVQIVGLGELFSAPYFALERRAIWRALAEDAFEGPTVRFMADLATRHGLVIIAPIYELDHTTGRRFNTAVVIDADGAVLGRYRKLHIPRGSNEQGRFDELFYYEPGDVPQNEPSPAILGDNPHFPVIQTAAGRIGVAICYDRHFEGVMRELARAGAQIVFSPAVTFGDKSRRMWELEFEVDAARHNLFIAGSNRLGSERPWNQHYFGASYFVGPNGRPPNLSTNPNLVIADLDLDQLEAADPSGWNLSRDARPDLYGPTT